MPVPPPQGLKRQAYYLIWVSLQVFLPEKEWVKGIKGEINEDKMGEGGQRQRKAYNYGKEVVGGMGMMV